MSTEPGLVDLLEAVNDERSLVRFMEALASDFADFQAVERSLPSPKYGPAAFGWENTRFDAVLDAAAAWAADTRGGKLDAPNPWRRFAGMLYAGKVYE